MWWWGAPFLWFIPWLVFLVIGFAVLRGFGFRRRGRPWGACGWHDGSSDPDTVLKRRLASGEINEAEYQRLKELLAH